MLLVVPIDERGNSLSEQLKFKQNKMKLLKLKLRFKTHFSWSN